MTYHEAQRIRDELLFLKVWIEHFQADRLCNLVPTEFSLILAKTHADNALALLDRVAQKEIAA